MTHHDFEPIFIGGAGRSGTTLLRVILDAHPDIACGPEIKVLPELMTLWEKMRTELSDALEYYVQDITDIDRSFAQMIAGLLEHYRISRHKKRVAEKTPNNIFYFAHLGQIFASAKFIHIARDGRDVVSSLLNTNWISSDGSRVPYTENEVAAAKYWGGIIDAARMLKSFPPLKNRFIEIRYEDLVCETKRVTQQICDFIGVPWSPEMLRHQSSHSDLSNETSAHDVQKAIYTTSIGKWSKRLNRDQIKKILPLLERNLTTLGYKIA